ncbi:MBL fold metallo-hydrolase [Pseudarcicella hirudinis]|uniref:MBL fold metallo-hydrolase n=1 Tax=Pseudarcicella hirudinis TaxID=1079859 RepID=UPI0035EA56C3
MNRRIFLQNSALTFGAIALLPHQELMAGVFSENPYKIKELRGGVSVFTEKGGTIAFLQGNDGLVVVDSQFPEQAGHLIEELKKSSEKPFRYLINTHHHGDHTGGNIAFKGLAEHVAGHKNCLINQQNSAQKQKTEDRQLYADLTFDDTWKQKVGKNISRRIISEQVIPMEMQSFILRMPILHIWVIWFLTAAILLLTEVPERILKAGFLYWIKP